MKQLITIGRLFYSLGIIAIGIHQLVIRKFRAEILPPFPAGLQSSSFAIVIGAALLLTGIVISGIVKTRADLKKKMCLYLAFYFLFVAIFFHLPYIVIVSPDSMWQLQVWFGIAEGLAYSGGALVMAGSFSVTNSDRKMNRFESGLEKLIPFGRIFYAVLIFVFGCSHFVYPAFVSTMVPKWIGSPLFWTYFVGAALIGAAIAITFKIWLKPVSLLLALMLFLFFLLFHIPDALANPYVDGGNEIARAFVALLFCGIALLIGFVAKNQITPH